MIQEQQTPYRTSMTADRSQIRYLARGIHSPNTLHYRLSQARSEQRTALRRKESGYYFEVQIEEFEDELRRRGVAIVRSTVITPIRQPLNRETCIQFIRSHQGATAREIAATFDVSETKAHDVLKAPVFDGTVSRRSGVGQRHSLAWQYFAD